MGLRVTLAALPASARTMCCFYQSPDRRLARAATGDPATCPNGNSFMRCVSHRDCRSVLLLAFQLGSARAPSQI